MSRWRERNRRARRFGRAARASVVAGLLLAGADASFAETAAATATTTAPASDGTASTCTAKRPTVLFNRWQEDWSVLANPCVPRAPLDGLKYIPLGNDPASYLSLGVNLRERLETNDAPLFGIGSAQSDTYLIQRVEVHADAHLGQHWQFFVQLQDARAFGKNTITPVDKNPLDLEQAFATYTGRSAAARSSSASAARRWRSTCSGSSPRATARTCGRRSMRCGPTTSTRSGASSRTRRSRCRTARCPRSTTCRTATSRSAACVSSGSRSGPATCRATGRATTAATRAFSTRAAPNGATWDVRYTGTQGRFDWDVETMLQTGTVGSSSIRAWAVGSIAGYRLDAPWSPRVALQVDAASGDRNPRDGRVGTFNPLFPNGYYFTLAGFTGYSNLIHVKPSVTLKPSPNLSLLGALGFQWRETTGDAVYQQGNAVVPGTAGKGGLWTGMYVQLRADWTIAANLIGAVEAVHFQVGDAIRQAGGHNADYVGVELKYGW